MQLAILAAGFTPGEADALRRAMAAWKRKGGLGRSTSGWSRAHARRATSRGPSPRRMFKQIEGFGEYGFPESHAASFALLVYVSAWLKCHHPDAHLCRPAQQPADGLLRGCARCAWASTRWHRGCRPT